MQLKQRLLRLGHGYSRQQAQRSDLS